MENKIKVSVCCLAYNQNWCIQEALDSVLMQQTTFDFELLVSDDASTDGTKEIIFDYAREYPEIIMPVFHSENQLKKTGRYPIVDLYKRAFGKYIAICDGDDYWTDPHKLQKQVDFMDSHPEYSLCFHDYNYLFFKKMLKPGYKERPKDLTPNELIGMAPHNFNIATSTMMFRNIYSPETAADFDKFLAHYMTIVMLGMYGGAKYLDDILPSIYRKYGSNSWASMPKREIEARTKQKVERLMELFKEKGNRHWIDLRRQVEA